MITLKDAIGRTVLGRDTAEQLGELRHVVVDPSGAKVVALVVRSGRNDKLVAWDDVTGFGPDAILVGATSAVRDPGSDAEKADAGGRRDPLGKRLLNDQGTSAGLVVDVHFDESTGVVDSFVGEHAIASADRLRGIGSYAVVVRASDDARAATVGV